MAVCCGRRRIGKSTLIEQAAKGHPFIELYGLPPRKGVTNATQLKHFAGLLAQQFKIPAPKYLEEINVNQTAEQNIKQLCFIKGGALLEEFDKIFNDLFGKNAASYQSIVQVLSDRAKTMDQICEDLKILPSGAFHKKLSILKECGFLTRDFVWNGNKVSKKLSKFRLKDNYLRFYLKYIKDKKMLIDAGLYQEVDLESLSYWPSIMGLQFENLVLNNLPIILKILKIAPESLLSAGPYFQNPTKRAKGFQIDVLIQTKFTYYLCEIKFSQHIGASIIDEVIQKIQRLSVPKNVSVRPVLIYQGELSKIVAKENFFSHIISFDDLLIPSTS